MKRVRRESYIEGGEGISGSYGYRGLFPAMGMGGERALCPVLEASIFVHGEYYNIIKSYSPVSYTARAINLLQIQSRVQ